MEHRELYTHTRNYGCRIRRFTMKGVEMLSLENQKIRVTLALGKGADIVEFLHKPTDTDLLWHSFNELKRINELPTVAASAGNFLDTYAGGWQDLLPTYGGNTLYEGGEIGIHGEACLYPWDCAVTEDTPERIEVLLSLRTVRSPFYIEKRLSLAENETKLTIREKVTNVGSEARDFMWGQHPAFGFPFLDENVEIRLPGKPKVTLPASTIAHRCPFHAEATGEWPYLRDTDGTVWDMSRAHAPEERLYMEYYASDLAEGGYELINHRTGLGMRMKWDLDTFRYIWVWGLYRGIDAYPWYGRAYVLGVEPWSSMPGDFAAAKESGTTLTLGAGESRETELTAELFEEAAK